MTIQVTWLQLRDGQTYREQHEFDDKKEAIDFAQGLGSGSGALVHDMESGKELWKQEDDDTCSSGSGGSGRSAGEQGEDIAGAASKARDARNADKAAADAAKAKPAEHVDGRDLGTKSQRDDLDEVTAAATTRTDADMANAGVQRGGPVRNRSTPDDSPANPLHSNAQHANPPGQNADTGKGGQGAARGGPPQDGAQATPGNPHQDGSSQSDPTKGNQPGKIGQQADAAPPQPASNPAQPGSTKPAQPSSTKP